MNEVNLILAAGNQTRWNYGDYIGLPEVKQLVMIEDEMLLHRIQRQFPGSITVTKDKLIAQQSEKWFDPEFNDITISTLFSTRDLWQDWTTILLGDVMYGRNTVKQIKRQKEHLMFYGDKGEIYAIKFHLQASTSIIGAISAIINSQHFELKYGKLWNLYRQLNGIDIRTHLITGWFTPVSDCRDFDTKEQYIKYAESKAI